MRSFPARLTAANSPRFLSCTWVHRSHEWSRWARKLDHSKKEGGGKPCFSDAELACRLTLQGRKQLFLGANAAVTRCLRRVFLRSSSIKLGFSDVSDSISLSQAVLYGRSLVPVQVGCVQLLSEWVLQGFRSVVSGSKTKDQDTKSEWNTSLDRDISLPLTSSVFIEEFFFSFSLFFFFFFLHLQATFEYCRDCVDEWILVPESTISQAMYFMLERHHKVCKKRTLVIFHSNRYLAVSKSIKLFINTQMWSLTRRCSTWKELGQPEVCTISHLKHEAAVFSKTPLCMVLPVIKVPVLHKFWNKSSSLHTGHAPTSTPTYTHTCRSTSQAVKRSDYLLSCCPGCWRRRGCQCWSIHAGGKAIRRPNCRHRVIWFQRVCHNHQTNYRGESIQHMTSPQQILSLERRQWQCLCSAV